ncbi:MAG: insertase [Sphingomonas bacterium]|nr:insertase [Sphingomonas bacterium]MDB5718673.1 insertase [Sphingomonas bacterium]
MDNWRNMVLAGVLTLAILIGWPMLTRRYFPVANPQSTQIVDGKSVAIPNPAADPAADSPVAARDRAIVLRESPRVRIESPRVAGSINLKGARIDDLVLTTHRETVDRNSPPIQLLSPGGTAKAYFAGFGWSGEGMALPGADTVWQASGTLLSPTTPVTLRWDNGQGQRFEIAFAIDQNYMITAVQRVANSGAGAVVAKPYALVSRSGKSPDPDSYTLHVGPIGTFGGVTNYTVDYDDLGQALPAQTFSSTGGWIGFSDKYWLVALAPDQRVPFTASMRGSAGERFQADTTIAPQLIAPGKVAQSTTRLFAGAKEIGVLQNYENVLGIVNFERAVDWGWFRIIEKPIFYLLDWLFRLSGNFGVAIILLTVVVRGLMFPVAQRQFASMAGMRAIQPKMKALQERHKDDKPKLQQEMLALYQSEKVNPIAGCLPIVLQIPIFYALYKVLMVTIEMRHQPLGLWIRDLSAPDPLTPLNLFGLLPFTPPSIIAIGVLPILLGITMYLQFKLNPQPMDEMQKQIFGFMPWIFMFVMAPFAAGLQLYWTVSNLLTIAQQKWLYSRHPGLKQATAK